MAKSRRRRARRNPVTNPIRRRRRRNPIANLRGYATRGRRRARRNPPNGGNGERGGLAIAGVKLPALQSIAFGTAGFLVPPILEGYLRPMLPANITTSQWGNYLMKAGTVFGLTWATRSFAGAAAAYKVGLGGGIYLAANILKDFMPNITPVAQPAAAYYPRLAAQPLLGDYGGGARLGNVTATTPSRLQPQSRY